MIYWFTGNTDTSIKLFSKKLKEFLQTEKRNWRRDVFYISDVDVSSDYHIAEIISTFIQSNGNDIVIDILPYDRNSLNKFKDEIGEDIVEIYVHNSHKKNKDNSTEIINSNQNTFAMDIYSENINQSFTKLIHYLRDINKL
jgi:hypothetical protein